MSDKVVAAIEELLQELGLDFSDPNLQGTPKRIAKMYREEFFCNVGTHFEGFTVFPNEPRVDEMVLLSGEFTSMCSHHFLPFEGKFWFGYIPDNLIVGASKPARLVAFEAKRPQLQEFLCNDVINTFWEKVQPKGCMVIMKAQHGCMRCRGAKSNGNMVTSAFRGCFSDPPVRDEFFKLIHIDSI